jgi:GGDEF domain-containing protein
VISIKKFLSQDSGAERARMHVVRILVQGIGQHAVAGEADECLRFRESIQEVSDALVDDIPQADLLVRAGSVLSALESHNRRTASRLRLQQVELQNMLKMLTSTMGIISAVSDANVSRLSEIEIQVASASALDDVRMIKSRLSDCLADIKREAENQRKETGATIEQLSQGLDEARRRSISIIESPEQDAVTGLPLRPEAETALIQSGKGGAQSYVAVLALDRLQTVNLRFGREAGDEVLVEFSRMVRKQLPPEDRLFRWSGAALLALLPRTGSLERVRSEIGRIMEIKLEHTIQTPSRSILLPIGARWTVFPMMAAPRLMYQKIDAFAAAPIPRD